VVINRWVSHSGLPLRSRPDVEVRPARCEVGVRELMGCKSRVPFALTSGLSALSRFLPSQRTVSVQ
jgi:hypothetical protein